MLYLVLQCFIANLPTTRPRCVFEIEKKEQSIEFLQGAGRF